MSFKKLFSKKTKIKKKVGSKYITSQDEITSDMIQLFSDAIRKALKAEPTHDTSLTIDYSHSDLQDTKYIYNFEKGYDGGLEQISTNFISARNGYISYGNVVDGTDPIQEIQMVENSNLISNYLITNEPLHDTDTPKHVKPIDVLHELEDIPSPFSLEELDAKIEILKDKISLIKDNSYSTKETFGIMERLINRKKWDEYSKYYSQFKNTSRENIQNLLNKYKLEFKSSDIFIPDFPDEAIKIMKEYEKQTLNLCGKKPIFYVIAESSMFQEKYKKRDPILLVQSPFGLYYQVLGAWDKEMLILSEL